MTDMATLAARAGVTFFDYQLDAFAGEAATPAEDLRACLYYKTGAGKSLTGLVMVAQAGCDAALVVAPPATHPQWVEVGTRLGVEVEPMSHAKFRMKDTRICRNKALIADEMHMFGGHGKAGFTKLDRLARGLKAPLILASATPNYNDAERVYCIKHILDPHGTKGGYIEFLHQHCLTESNPFSMTPNVVGFHKYPDAAAFLADLPHVYYLPDDLVYSITDIEIPEKIFPEMDDYGLNLRRRRIIASGIEERHARVFNNLVRDDGWLDDTAYNIVVDLLMTRTTPVLVYADHSTIADALDLRLGRLSGCKSALVTGSTPKKKKAERIAAFRDGVLDVLVGTATLATGTDGFDKVCDRLIILDDTDDASLRRQLIGRIMPRGSDTDATKKQVYRLVLIP